MSRLRQVRHLRPLVLAALLLLAASGHAGAPEADWNDSGIEWQDYRAGMDAIEITGRPGLLLFYTNWCPHCTRYSGVFHDREVVELARDFVMIRVDKDQAAALNQEYAARGGYVPRTLFVDSSGEVDWSTAGSHPRYPHFLDTTDPAELVSLMRRFRAASR
jgi:thiol-disulfide isomerase/thioredoxin